MLSTLLQVDPLCSGNSFNFISVYILPPESLLLLLSPLEFLQFGACSFFSSMDYWRTIDTQARTTTLVTQKHILTPLCADDGHEGRGRKQHLGSGFYKLRKDLQRDYKQKLARHVDGCRQLSLLLMCFQMSFSLSRTCLLPVSYVPSVAQLSWK